ncbi:hypothetical protein HY493_03205 [Candidatus Woesearchaeota archaeon]|nr:hypothetical protein [Candidatus Woesearchaeota archaeon]
MQVDVQYVSIRAGDNGGFVASYGSSTWGVAGLYSLGQLMATLPHAALLATPSFDVNVNRKDITIISGMRDKILHNTFRELSAEEISEIERRTGSLERCVLTPSHDAPARHPIQ